MLARDLTTGSIGKNILVFSIPYLISYFLQTLYGMADLFIIGQFQGAASITAVSIGSQVMHMVTVIIVGLAMGTTITIARSVGARDKAAVSRSIGNTVTLFLGVSVALAAVMVALLPHLVAIMSTPEEAVAGTHDYLYYCALGIPLIAAYNIIAAIFRGLGDTRSPMYFIAVACVLNIVLDYVFLGAVGMGPEGAAIATVIAQGVSVVISLFYIRRGRAGSSVARREFRPARRAVTRSAARSVSAFSSPSSCSSRPRMCSRSSRATWPSWHPARITSTAMSSTASSRESISASAGISAPMAVRKSRSSTTSFRLPARASRSRISLRPCSR